MIDNIEDKVVGSDNKTPMVLLVQPNSPLIGLRDPRSGLLIVIGCQVAVCPECGSVQLEESWSAGGGCFNPDCSLSPVLPIPTLPQEVTPSFHNHKPVPPVGLPAQPNPAPEASQPAVTPQATVPKPPTTTPPQPESSVAAPIPPKPKPAPRPIVSRAAKPPPYIAPKSQSVPPPPAAPRQTEPPLPQSEPISAPQPEPVAPPSSPITSTMPPPIMEIPEGWLAPTPAAEAVPPPVKPEVAEEKPPPHPAFSAAAPPPEGSIIPTPMLLSEEVPEELPTVIAPPIAQRLCILCAKPIAANDKVRICARCGAVHHLECWEANRGCGRPLCGSKVTLAQARSEASVDEPPTKPFYSDPWGKPHRPSFGESLRTILGKKEILIGFAAVVVVVVIIFILISAFGQTPPPEAKGSVTVTVPSGSQTGSDTKTTPKEPTGEPSTSIMPGITPKVTNRTGKKQPTTVETPKVTTPPTGPSELVLPPLEASDIRQGLAGVQQNASIRYQNMLKKKRDLRGSIIVTFTVNPNGTVSGLMVAKNTMNDSALGKELESQINSGIKRVRFRQSPKGKTTSFTFSFTPS